MILNKWKIRAYATLVRAGKYILSEEEREFEYQILVPVEYQIAVAEHMIK